MSRKAIRKNSSFSTDSDEEVKKKINSDNSSDKSDKSRTKNKSDSNQKSSFFERITGSVKYSSDSETESEMTRAQSSERREKINKNKPFSRPDLSINESGSDTSSSTKSYADSDKPAPKTNPSVKSNFRSNSISSENSISKLSANESKKRNQRKKRSSSSSSLSSNSSLTISKSHTKSTKNSKKSSDSEDDYAHGSGHVTKVKLEKKPPIGKSNRNSSKLSSRPSSRLNDSISDSLDSRRSYTISDSTLVSKHRNNNKLNQTFDLDFNNSDNEITDVSPLPTPKNDVKSKLNIKSKIKEKETRRNSLDMSAFYKVLNEDINKRMDSVFTIFNEKQNKEHKSTSFDLKRTDLPDSKISAKISKIESENERLYKKLLSTATTKSNFLTRHDSFYNKPMRLTSSALNRQREQQRIEKENQKILKRLLKVKATKNLVKEEQFKDYEKNFGGFGQSYSRINSSLSGFNSLTVGLNGNNSSFISMNKQSGKSTANTSLIHSRISSAKSSSKSRASNISILDPDELLKRATFSTKARPEWNDRW